MRIPITMCHGIALEGEKPLTVERFDSLMKIAGEMGFQSMGYDDLAAWSEGKSSLVERPIMIDFDHPVKSMRYEVYEVMERYGFRGNLFVNTGPLEQMYRGPFPTEEERQFMTWEEIGELKDAGWQIGNHTHTHPNLSELFLEDPTGAKLREELEKCDSLLKKHLGIVPRDFAFTGITWSSRAEEEVKKRYRFGRLWIIGATYHADGEEIRYADMVGVPGEDEEDGGPPAAARYITEKSDPYRLPSMELQALIHEDEAFRRYLGGALPL